MGKENSNLNKTIAEVLTLKKIIGVGGASKVFSAELDLKKFDFSRLYAYTQVQGSNHSARLNKANTMVEEISDLKLDKNTIKQILKLQKIALPHKEVAVKISKPDSSPEMFEAEWKNLICLNDKNVIQVYCGGKHGNHLYYAMELIHDVVSSQTIITEFDLQQKLLIIFRAGRGLDYLHKHDIIHRDVKPSNMITGIVGKNKYNTKITDLGTARNLDLEMEENGARRIVGTPHFMAPEQITTPNDVDKRCDVYSLGASLYELSTGIKPFAEIKTPKDIIKAKYHQAQPKKPSEVCRNIPSTLEQIILRAMHIDKNSRYESISQLVVDLKTFIQSEQKALAKCKSFDEFLSKEHQKQKYFFKVIQIRLQKEDESNRENSEKTSNEKKNSKKLKRTRSKRVR